MIECLFCSIIKGTIPSEMVYRDEDFCIIKDINPMAKIHLLAIPLVHYATIDQQTEEGAAVLGKILHKISVIAPTLGLENGYRLIINQGEHSGQEVLHLHIHILGGEPLHGFCSKHDKNCK